MRKQKTLWPIVPAAGIAATIWLIALLWAWLPSSYVILTTNVPNYGDFPVAWETNTSSGDAVLHLNHFHNRYPIPIELEDSLNTLEIQPDRRLGSMFIRSIEIKFPWALSTLYSGAELFEVASVEHIGMLKQSGKGVVIKQFTPDAKLTLHLNADKNAASKIVLLIAILCGAVIIAAVVYLMAILFRNRPRWLRAIAKLSVLATLIPWFLADTFPVARFISALLLAAAAAVTTGLLFLYSQLDVESDVVENKRHRLTGYLLAGLVVFVFAAHAGVYRWVFDASQTAPVKLASSYDVSRFASNIEKNFASALPYRDWLVYINSLIKTVVFKRSPNSKVILGEDGMFFEGYGERKVEKGSIQNFDNVTDYIGLSPFPKAHLEQWLHVLQARQCWLNNHGIEYVFALAPTKGMVYPEYLPRRIRTLQNRADLKTRYDELLEHIQNNSSVPIVDIRKSLMTAKTTQASRLFYKTDFHWNFLGSFFAYRPIAAKLSERFPERGITPMTLDNFDINLDENWYHPRFLNLIGYKPEFHNTEHYLALQPKPGSPASSINALPEIGISDTEFPVEMIRGPDGTEAPVRTVRNAGGELDAMLILGDSFIEKSVLYLASHAKATYFQRAVFQFPHHLVTSLKPDVVVQEVLNMFILRDPPHNPQEVWNHYSDGECVSQTQTPPS